MPLPSNIRSSHREDAFRRYAKVIGTALACYPQVIVVDPDGLSIETYSARCRDAIKAKQLYKWTNAHVNDLLFDKHSHDLVVSMQGGKVVIGPKDAVKAHSQKPVVTLGLVVTGSSKNDVEVANSPINLQLLCTLLSVRAFNPCPSFYVKNVDLQVLKGLESRFDIAFEQDPTDTTKFYII